MKSTVFKYKKLLQSREAGVAFVLFILAFLILFVYGLVVLKGDLNYTDRQRLSLRIVSAVNAASNSAPGPQNMYYSACKHLALFFNESDLGTAGCTSNDFTNTSSPPNYTATWTNVNSIDGTMVCDRIDFVFDPSDITVGPNAVMTGAEDDEFCIDITGCRKPNSIIPPFLTPGEYDLGGTACIARPPVAVMLLVSSSRSLSEIFNMNTTPPVPFLLPEAQPNGADVWSSRIAIDPVNDYPKIRRDALPYEFDPNVPGGAHFSPFVQKPYIRPFGEKQFRSVGGTANQDPELSDPSTAPYWIASMPDVVPETVSSGHPQDSKYSNPPFPPDPAQSLPQYKGDVFSWQWATYFESFLQSNYRWRHAVVSQQELSHRCFGPFKLWYERLAMQIMYMLDSYVMPFGVVMYSNWLMPLMPLVPMQHRNHTDWPFGQKVLNFPLLGPDPTPLGAFTTPDYILEQFGDPAGSDTSGTLLTKQKMLDLLQPMSICASHLAHEIDPNPFGRRVFTALPNPYDINMPVYIDTTCAAPNPPVPSIEPYLGFEWREDGKCYWNIDATPGEDKCVPTIYGGLAKYDLPQQITDWSFIPNPETIPSAPITHPWRWCPFATTATPSAQVPNVATAMASIRSGGLTKSGHFLHSVPPSGSCPSDWESRVFTSMTDPNVYPETSTGINDAFLSGALLQTYRIFQDPQFFPMPNSVKRMVIVLTDRAPNLDFRDATNGCLNGCNQCAWLAPNPLNTELPVLSGSTAQFTNAVRESAELIHRMADDNIKVVVLMVDHEAPGIPDPAKDFFVSSLAAPVCSDTSLDPDKLHYQLCQPGGVSNPLPGEPTGCGNTTCNENKTPDNIHRIQIGRQVGELFPDWQRRLFLEAASQISQIINDFKLKK